MYIKYTYKYTVATTVGQVLAQSHSEQITRGQLARAMMKICFPTTLRVLCNYPTCMFAGRTTTPPPPAALFVGPYRFNYSTLSYLRRTPFGQVL